jgi:protein-S-isoprenylcysteine O-methyltransferase Ste14
MFMHAVDLVFAVGWAAFWIYWIAAALSMKRAHVAWSHELRIRAVIFILAILVFRVGDLRVTSSHSDAWRASGGLVLFATGLGLAIWARLYIGRNWGPPMTRKDEPELVTTGPYRWIRHPIYSGILTAAIGTAIALNWWWLILTSFGALYFVYSALVEERYLTGQFPATYPAYRQSTKMLVPFIF